MYARDDADSHDGMAEHMHMVAVSNSAKFSHESARTGAHV